jgi:hypothetical protein
MSDLEDQRRKRPGNRDRIDQIKNEMDRDVLRTRIATPDDLRISIAAVLLTHQHVNGKCLCQSLREHTTSGQHAQHVADVLIRELGLGTLLH